MRVIIPARAGLHVIFCQISRVYEPYVAFTVFLHVPIGLNAATPANGVPLHAHHGPPLAHRARHVHHQLGIACLGPAPQALAQHGSARWAGQSSDAALAR